MNSKSKILGLFWALSAIPHHLLSQTLLLERNDGKNFSYSVINKQFVPVATYDSTSYSKGNVRFNGNTYDGDDCCKRFFVKEKVLLMRYCGIAVMKGNTILWKKMSIDCPTECRKVEPSPCSKMDREVFDFTKDNEWVLMVNHASPMFVTRCSVVEYNMATGVQKAYHLKADKPSYSPDNRYLLMRSYTNRDRYYIYDRMNNAKVATLKNIKEISWLD
ncbi:MAG TPA: hypothetical protein VEB40_06490 [Flavipsychrobacter sp.]|nr:hypothetical protein [Flavipsychrobacter sp.]